MVFRRFAIRHDLAVRHFQVDAHMKQVTLVVVPVVQLDRNATTHEGGIKTLQGLHALANPVLDRRRGLHVAKHDLHGQLHDDFRG